MFSVEYRIHDDERYRLAAMTPEELRCLHNFYVDATFRLNFNGSELGSYSMDNPYAGEYVDDWLFLLNSAVALLSSSSYARIAIPETGDLWLEFFLDDSEKMTMRYIRTDIEDFINYQCTDIAAEPLDVRCVVEDIDAGEFISSIINVTERFISEVYSINPVFPKLRPLISLEKIHSEASGKRSEVMDTITYDMIAHSQVPVFNGILSGGTVYEFSLSQPDPCKGAPRIASLACVSQSIKSRCLPCALCSLYEVTAEGGLLLECGEGSHGSVGYVCLSKDGEIIFLACFDESNPFIAASLREDTIIAQNNLGETWTFRFGGNEPPSVAITDPI